MRAGLVLLLALAGLPAAPDLTCRLSFDEVTTPTVAGLDGRALVGGETAFTLPLHGELSLRQGSLSLWVQPLDWRGDDDKYHWFVSGTLGRGGYWIVYKNSSPATGLMFGWDPDEGPARRFSRSVAIRDWQPGAWHHVAATWSDHDRVELYLDGRRVGLVRGIGLPDDRLLPAKLTLGQPQTGHPGKTALDELRLYRRCLTAREVLALYAEHAPAEALTAARAALPPAEDIPTVWLRTSPLDHRLLVHLRADCLGEPAVASAELTVNTTDGRELLRRTLTPRDGLIDEAVPLPPQPLGRHRATLVLRDAAGSERGRTTAAVPVPTALDWAGAAKLGLAPKIPPPYGPLRREGQAVHTGTATIGLGPSGLPNSLVAGGEELLAAPVRLTWNKLEGHGSGCTWGGDEAAATASATQRSPAGDVAVAARVEYDNLCWFEVTVPPAVAARAEGLRLEVPLRRVHAPYLEALLPASQAEQLIPGYVVLQPGKPWTSDRFVPAIWLGSADRGVGWFAESDQYWSRAPGPVATVRTVGDWTVLSLRLLSGSVAASRPLVFRFGLQPTPVRRLDPAWRAEQWVPSVETTTHYLSLDDAKATPPAAPPHGRLAYLYRYNEFCNTLPDRPEAFRRQVTAAQRWGQFVVPYTDVLDTQEGSAEALLYGSELFTTPGARFASSPDSAVEAAPAGKAADRYVWFAHHLAQDYGLNGLYIDEAWVHPCTGPAEAGLGYTDEDGTRRATWPFLARREELRRVRNVFAAAGRPFRIVLHLSGARVPPLFSMGDQVLLGEELYLPCTRDPIYAHTLTPERARAAYLGSSIGLPAVVLPPFKASGERMADPKLARGLLAVALPHDLLVWPLFAAAPPLLEARATLAAAGVEGRETTFVPYWDAHPPATAPEGVLVSAWRTAPGAAVVVANPTDTARPGLRVRLDLARLGLKPAKATGATLDGDTLTLNLAAQDFALVSLEP